MDKTKKKNPCVGTNTLFKIGYYVRVHSKSSKDFGKFAKVTNVGRKKLTVDFGRCNYGYVSKDCIYVEEYDTIEREDSDNPVEGGKSPKKKPFASPEKLHRVRKGEYLDPPSIGEYLVEI